MLLLTLPVVTLAQVADTVQSKNVATDTVKNRFLPTGIRLGTDLISLVKTQRQLNYDGWEINADIDLYRYFLSFEYGEWSRHFDSPGGVYDNSGTYWRVGPDVNFLLKDPDRNLVFIGFRYGRSKFSETYNISTADSLWGPINGIYQHTDVPARWLELTGGLKVRIWKFIWMGYTGRFNFALKTGPTPTMLPHDIPGFGNTSKKTTWGFNYYIMMRIPFRKMPPLPPSRK